MAHDIILTWYEIALLVLAPMCSMGLILWCIGRAPKRDVTYHPQRHHYDDCH
jgi:hypothetical protein